MENHPFFMSKLPEDGEQLPAAVEGYFKSLKSTAPAWKIRN